MTGCLVLTVSPDPLASQTEDTGWLVASALSTQGIPIASRQTVDEDLEVPLRGERQSAWRGHQRQQPVGRIGGAQHGVVQERQS